MLKNPYLTHFRAIHGTSPSAFQHRNPLVRKYSWAVPDEVAVRVIAGLGPTVEIGAGTGYWAKLITDAGGDVVAYDDAPYANHWCDGEHFRVHRGGYAPAGKHPDRVLFLCWPPYDNALAADALLSYEAAGGETLVYVGESVGGCTASHEFFSLLSTGWEAHQTIDVPQWFGINDYLTVYRRKQ